MAVKLYLIRHGDPDYARDSLTQAGRRQAQALAQAWPAPLDAVVCSPLGRAQCTAAPLAAARCLPVRTKAWLREMDDVTVAHKTRPDLAVWKLEPAVLMSLAAESWTRAPVFAGSGLDGRWREVCRGADALLAERGLVREDGAWRCAHGAAPAGAVALVAHLGVGLTLLGYLLGVCPAHLWASAYLPPASVTQLTLEPQGEAGLYSFRMTCLGGVAHLLCAGAPVTWSGLRGAPGAL